MRRITALALLFAGSMLAAVPAQAASFFGAGNIVVAVEGAGVRGATSGPYTLNQAAPLSVAQYSHAGTASATYVNTLVLPQSNSGANFAVSGEYGSSSEGFIQRSGDGRYLTIMGYGVNAAAFNSNPTGFGTLTTDPTKPNALGQSGSLSGQGYTAVPRVMALIGADGSVDSSTAINGVFNGNNPRAAYTADGTSFYISGQGVSGDHTGGVFLTTLGSHSATAITGDDTSGKTAGQDTRYITGANGQIYVSADTKQGSNAARDFVGSLGAGPNGLYDNGNGPTQLPGFGSSASGKYLLTSLGQTNGINSVGQEINLSPEQFFFANSTTLYVADSGAPKNNSASNSRGDGGLQKWSLIGGAWTLDYTISAGLNLVRNNGTTGTTGLFGLAGQVVGDSVQIFATNFTLGETDQTYLFGLTDVLSATARPLGEAFTVLDAAPVDSKFRGVSFTPDAQAVAGVPEPATWSLMIIGIGVAGGLVRKAQRKARWPTWA